MTNLYHEKQFKNYCRCHAINNLCGNQIITVGEFDKYCDSFDITHNHEKGISRRNYYFINNGNTDNIFGYILQKKGYNIGMRHYDYYKKKTIVLPASPADSSSCRCPPTMVSINVIRS